MLFERLHKSALNAPISSSNPGSNNLGALATEIILLSHSALDDELSQYITELSHYHILL